MSTVHVWTSCFSKERLFVIARMLFTVFRCVHILREIERSRSIFDPSVLAYRFPSCIRALSDARLCGNSEVESFPFHFMLFVASSFIQIAGDFHLSMMFRLVNWFRSWDQLDHLIHGGVCVSPSFHWLTMMEWMVEFKDVNVIPFRQLSCFEAFKFLR